MHFDNKVVVGTDIPTRRVASYTIVAKRLDEDATWYGSLRGGHIVLHGFPTSQRSAKGTQHTPLF